MKKNAFTVRAAFKAAGIIAAVAMVGFSMMGCPTEDEGPNWGNPPPELVGTWKQGLDTIKIDSDATFTSTWGVGTYKTEDHRFIATVTGLGAYEGDWALDTAGTTMTLKFDDSTADGLMGGNNWIKQ